MEFFISCRTFEYESNAAARRVAAIIQQHEPEFEHFWRDAECMSALLSQVIDSANTLAKPTSMLSAVLPHYMQVRRFADCVASSKNVIGSE